MWGDATIVVIPLRPDQEPTLEAGSGAHERDQMRCVDGSPAFLGGLDELERHRQRGDPGPGTVRGAGVGKAAAARAIEAAPKAASS